VKVCKHTPATTLQINPTRHIQQPEAARQMIHFDFKKWTSGQKIYSKWNKKPGHCTLVKKNE